MTRGAWTPLIVVLPVSTSRATVSRAKRLPKTDPTNFGSRKEGFPPKIGCPDEGLGLEVTWAGQMIFGDLYSTKEPASDARGKKTRKQEAEVEDTLVEYRLYLLLLSPRRLIRTKPGVAHGR